MKTRITGLILCLMMFCACIFSGCNLIVTDQKAYNNTVVATFIDKETKEKHTVIKKDLEDLYKSYSQYFQQQGVDEKTALNQTLELLVNRKIMLVEAEKVLDDLDDKEKTYIWKQTLEGIQNLFQQCVSNLKGEENDNSESSSERTFNPYQKNGDIKKNNDDFMIVKTNPEKREIDTFTDYDPSDKHDASDEEDRKLILTKFKSVVNSEIADEVYSQAYSDLIKALKKAENGLGLSTDPDEILLRKIKDIYQDCYEDYMITKYQESFRNFDETTNISVQNILDEYSSLVTSSYVKYSTLVENSSSYESDMQSNSTNLYYVRSGADDTKFFQVAHVLLRFADEGEAYKALKEKYGATSNGEFSEKSSFQAEVDKLVGQIKPIVRRKNDMGEYVVVEDKEISEVEKNANSLAKYIKQQVDAKTNVQDKINLFRDFIYRYNDDPGMINATNNYTIGVNKSQAEDDEEYKTYSNYVEEFTDTAIKLYDDGKGKIGNVSDPVVTENGVHILFYVGEVENIFDGFNIDENFHLSNNTLYNGLTPIEVLNSTKINIFDNKTVFDVIYDSLYTDNFANFQENLINDLRNQYKIQHHVSAYEDLA